ncbi:hypothetical protein [Runella limosa]|uniref:hypothetical protein n=1 Tax=Runella limosa TaxID=370978 RepID=UPI0004909072|nr:hypothetical protein [Runella limosa]
MIFDAFPLNHKFKSYTLICVQLFSGLDSWYQDIINPSIPKGSSLVLRAKIRTEKIEGGTVAMYIYGLFDNKKKENFFVSTEGSQKIEGTSNFKEYSLRLDNYVDRYSPTEVLQVGLIISGSTTGDVYFDDISLLIE